MRQVMIALLVGVLSLAFAACGGSGASTAPSAEAPAPEASAPAASAPAGGAAACTVVTDTASGDAQATIAGNAFDPATISLTAGQSVTFTNEDGVAHTVTLDDGSCDTGNIAGGSGVTVEFTAAGSYPFHCNIHPSMTGTVEVS